MIAYTVRVHFENPDVRDRWVEWIESEHAGDVVAAGAESAEVVVHDDCGYGCEAEVRYRFADRDAFEAYERDHAPRLRAESLEKFPLEGGMKYERTVGEARTAARSEIGM